MSNNVLMKFDELGIISGDQKRHLEDYLDARFFSQRKEFDEYYIDIQEVDFENINIQDLMYLAEKFKVKVTESLIILNDIN